MMVNTALNILFKGPITPYPKTAVHKYATYTSKYYFSLDLDLSTEQPALATKLLVLIKDLIQVCQYYLCHFINSPAIS